MRRAAALLLVVLAACAGSPNQRPKTKAHATTTASTATTATTAASTTTTGSVALARPCSADDLGVSSLEVGAAGGHSGLFVRFQNISASPCSLSGYPVAVTADAAGGQHLANFGKGVSFPEPEPGNLESHSCCGLVIIETSQACSDGNGNPPQVFYKNLHISPPGGGAISLGDVVVDGTCYVNASKLGMEPAR